MVTLNVCQMELKFEVQNLPKYFLSPEMLPEM
jgi:hypothetical protein